MKKIPKLENEDHEREYWATQDSAEVVDWSRARRVAFPNLKPTVKTISLRLPESLLDRLKALANERDVPYQSLLKVFLAERVDLEMRLARSRG